MALPEPSANFHLLIEKTHKLNNKKRLLRHWSCHPPRQCSQDILLLLRQRLRQERRYDLADALLEILRPRLEAAGLRLEDDRDTGSQKIY